MDSLNNPPNDEKKVKSCHVTSLVGTTWIFSTTDINELKTLIARELDTISILITCIQNDSIITDLDEIIDTTSTINLNCIHNGNLCEHSLESIANALIHHLSIDDYRIIYWLEKNITENLIIKKIVQLSWLQSAQNGYNNILYYFLKIDREDEDNIIEKEQSYHILKNILQNNKIDINCTNEMKRTALLFSTVNGHYTSVQLLIQAHADMNLSDACGNFPLLEASCRGYDAIVEYLLIQKVDIHLCSRYGFTPIIEAVNENHFHICSLLIDARVDINKSNKWKNTPLRLAIENNFISITKLLLHSLADTNRIYDNDTVLIQASKNGYYEIVKALCEARTYTDIQDAEGHTALMWGAKKGFHEIVTILCEARAHVDVRDAKGYTALMWGTENGHETVVQILKEKNHTGLPMWKRKSTGSTRDDM